MKQIFKNLDGKDIILSKEPFASSGGEGTIYEVLNATNRALVAKIYHTKQIADSRKDKIAYMFRNNPTQNEPEEIKKAIIWVEDVLFKDGNFVGFVMKKVTNAIPLKSLTLARNPSKTHGIKWKKFDHDQVGSHQNRLVVAYNLAQAVKAIHARGNYVLVDMKPENIFVREEASIAMIDLDSIQIKAQDISFPSIVYTEEYAPVEKHQGLIDPKNGDIDKDWDYFSLAVIIYELFLGIHPYQASHSKFTTRPELIKNNLYVHGRKSIYLHTIPAIHKNFKRLAPELKALFDDAFEANILSQKLRPSPSKWVQTILPLFNLPETQEIKMKKVNPVLKNKPRSVSKVIEDIPGLKESLPYPAPVGNTASLQGAGQTIVQKLNVELEEYIGVGLFFSSVLSVIGLKYLYDYMFADPFHFFHFVFGGIMSVWFVVIVFYRVNLKKIFPIKDFTAFAKPIVVLTLLTSLLMLLLFLIVPEFGILIPIFAVTVAKTVQLKMW